jgi:hypothetical protein
MRVAVALPSGSWSLSTCAPVARGRCRGAWHARSFSRMRPISSMARGRARCSCLRCSSRVAGSPSLLATQTLYPSEQLRLARAASAKGPLPGRPAYPFVRTRTCSGVEDASPWRQDRRGTLGWSAGGLTPGFSGRSLDANAWLALRDPARFVFRARAMPLGRGNHLRKAVVSVGVDASVGANVGVAGEVLGRSLARRRRPLAGRLEPRKGLTRGGGTVSGDGRRSAPRSSSIRAARPLELIALP